MAKPKSNFTQPPTAPHAGVFAHAYTPTDAELTATARGWLAAGGTLVRIAYSEEDGELGICWWARTAEGKCLDGLAQRIAEAVVDGMGRELKRTEQGTHVTLFTRREG